MIEIGLCADNNFSLPLGVCVYSIFSSNTNNKIRIHILSKGISTRNRQRIKQTADEFKQEVVFYEIDDSILKDLPIVQGRFPTPIYYRFLFVKVLPIEVNRFLYLDSDVLVVGDLKELFYTDLKDTYCGAVLNQSCDNVGWNNRLDIDYPTFNSGVLLFDVAKWQKNHIVNKALDYLNKDTYVPFTPDQDALNIVFENNVTILPWRYNFQEDLLKDRSCAFLKKERWAGIDNDFLNLVIIHFCSEVKPWYKDCISPLRFLWLKAYRNSLWRKEKLKWKRTLKERIRHKYFLKDLSFNINPEYIEHIKRLSNT